MLIVSSISVVVDISVVSFVIHISHVLLLWSFVILFASRVVTCVASFKVVSECWVFVEGNGFEFAIGVEAENHDEGIIYKADDWIDIDVFIDSIYGVSFNVNVSEGVDLILDGGQEIDQEGHCEEDAEEDEEHDALVAALVLNHPDDQDEEKSENGLRDKLLRCDEV